MRMSNQKVKLNYRTKDLLNVQFGHLKVISFSGYPKNRACWNCLCNCGNLVVVMAQSLLDGSTSSCGCKNDDDLKRLNRKVAGHASWQRLYRNYIRRSLDKDLELDVSLEEFKTLCTKECYYCGQLPKRVNAVMAQKFMSADGKARQWIEANGLDRVDNSRGYTKDNVRSCCIRCNKAKLDQTENDFYLWLEKAYLCMKKRN